MQSIGIMQTAIERKAAFVRLKAGTPPLDSGGDPVGPPVAREPRTPEILDAGDPPTAELQARTADGRFA